MRKLVLCSIAVAAVAWSAPAAAQTPKPGTVNPPAADTGSTANTTATAGGLAVGLSVKDSTGATVGKLTSLKTDATGKRMATISMGGDTVSVDADKLRAKDGAATVSLTQAQLKAMAKKPRS
jgi:hypothetical protein